MKANRKVMLGAALVVAIVAFAAVGYATVYKGTTENSGNSIGVTWVKLSQGDAAKYNGESFLGDIIFDTQNTGVDATTYTLAENWTAQYTGVTGAPSETAKKLDKGNLTLTLADTESASYTLKISTTDVWPTGFTGLTLYFGIATDLEDSSTFKWASAGSTSEWTITGVTAETYHVVVGVSGTATNPGTAPFSDITFTFEASGTVA